MSEWINTFLLVVIIFIFFLRQYHVNKFIKRYTVEVNEAFNEMYADIVEMLEEIKGKNDE